MRSSLFLGRSSTSASGLKTVTLEALNIGNRITFGSWNLWFDEKASIMRKNGDVNIRQHEPERKEKVVFFSEKWEGPSSTYATTISYENSKKEHVYSLVLSVLFW